MSNLYSIQFFGFEERSRYWSVQFVRFVFSAFHWSPSIGKPHMTPVFFVKTTNHTRFHWSVVIINRKTSYESGIFRQDYGIIRGLPMNHTRLPIWVVQLPEWTKRAGLMTESDQAVRAVRSCNSWLKSF